MMWRILRTETFARHLKHHRHHHGLLLELEKKIKRLRINPGVIGGNLSGALHGQRSTRLTKNFRVIFAIDEDNKVVYLMAIDHRGKVYG